MLYLCGMNNANNNIMKLSLTKKYQGYYTKRVGDIRVVVEKNSESKGWSGCVESYTHTATDMEGTQVEMFETLTEYAASTKKEVCSALTNYILNPEKY